jgi:hypothetical protein
MQSIFSDVKEYISKNIDISDKLDDPFEHCIVDNILPENIMEAIYLNWPLEVMVPIPETGRTTKYVERKVMLFQPSFLEQLPEDKKFFWIELSKTLISTEIISSCYDKFRFTLDKRIKHLGHLKNINSEMLLVSDSKDYAIGPHTDSRSRFISLLLYLSKDIKYKDSGTCFYKPINKKTPVQDLRHHKFEDFSRIKKIKYKPNRLVFFPRTDISYHGVEHIKIDNCDRRLIIINIKAPEGAI